MSLTQTVDTSTVQSIPSDQSLGPAAVVLRMEPGSEIPRHLHEHTTETAYVLEGDFINEGISYPKGTQISVKPMTAHGPQSTKDGCSVLITFSYPATPEDFKLA